MMTNQLFHSLRPQDQISPIHWVLLALVLTMGAALRFWGLGNIGLHGDEDVMALATRALRETGAPLLPSGMYYVRALPQLYLMALSTEIFGDTEWALRLPSVLIGTLGILVGYWLGRRFLSVNSAIVFAVAIALLPSLISLSQTARMYGFYVTLVMLFAVAMFRWERTESIAAYLIAVLTCMVSLSFHALTVFSTLLFFYPGILKLSWRLFGLGGVAFIACIIFQQEHSAWVGSHYFETIKVAPDDGMVIAEPLARKVGFLTALLGAAIGAASAAIAFGIARRRGMAAYQTVWLTLSVPCLLSAMILGLLFQYHLATLAYILGTIFFVRAGFSVVRPAIIGVLLVAIFGIQASIAWRSPNVQSLYDLAEIMAGLPYPKLYLTFSGFSPLGVVVYGIVAFFFAIQFARRRPLPDHVLFFLISVFAPLFLMGFLSGQYVPERYVIGFLPFFVLSAFAGVLDLISRYSGRLPVKLPVAQMATSAILVVMFVNPKDLSRNVNPQNSDFPILTDHRGVDHKGAAEYVLSQDLGAEDIVISVDTQQQVYYLGDRVDYYMRSLKASSRNSSFVRDQEVLCLYTGTPQITTGAQLAELLSEPRSRDFLIIGSGELDSNPERSLGDGLWETMQRFGVEEVYRGRDNATKVWRYIAGVETADRRQGNHGD